MKKLLLSDIVQPSVEGNADFFSRKAKAEDFEGLMDPVIAIHHFETTRNAPGAFAHSGISEIFYIFEDSASYQTIDAKGNNNVVTPGGLLWVQAGRGTEHSEGPVRRGSRVEGIQLFLDLANQKSKPGTLSVKSNQVPVIESEGVKVRVLSGRTGDTISGAKTPQELTLLHITLEPGKEFRHNLPARWSGTVFAIEGHFDLMAADETFEIEEGMVMAMAHSHSDETIVFTGLAASQLLFVSGLPVHEIHPTQEMSGREPHLVPSGTHQTAGENSDL